jgi:hypothetical protein
VLHMLTPILGLLCLMYCFTSVQAPDPNQRTDYDVLPGMRKWNGQPSHDFTLVWFAALGTALGAIAQDGYTLYQTAKGLDAGINAPAALAVGATPAETAAHERATKQHEGHILRNNRLAACILNYISTTCSIYHFLTTNCRSEGKAMYAYIEFEGDLPYTDEQKEELLDEWEKATMAKVGIAFASGSLFQWLDWIHNFSARKMKKSLRQQRTKFLNGLPNSFRDAIMTETLAGPDGTCVFAATFPAHHPQGGQNRPADQVGKPDLTSLVHKLYPEWARRIKTGMIKAVPKGSVYQANDDNDMPELVSDSSEDDDDDDELMANAVKGKHPNINGKSICSACGGLGHWATVDGIACLTRKLNITIPKDTLKQIRYPDGMRYPDFDRTKGKQNADRVDQADSRKSPRRRFPAKPSKTKGFKGSFKRKPKSVKQVEVTSNDPGPSQSETEVDPEVQQDSSSDDEGDHNVKLAVNFGAITITPPPSPPQEALKECSDCFD